MMTMTMTHNRSLITTPSKFLIRDIIGKCIADQFHVIRHQPLPYKTRLRRSWKSNTTTRVTESLLTREELTNQKQEYTPISPDEITVKTATGEKVRLKLYS